MIDCYVQDVIDSIVDYNPPSSIWIHEKVLCRAIPNVDGCSAREALTKSINHLKKGFIGTQRKNTRINQGKQDLTDCNNGLSIILQTHGNEEDFSTTSLSTNDTTRNKPRWFFYGKSPTLSVKTQLRIARKAMGIAQGCHDEIATQNWMKWYLKNAGETRPYRSKVSNICEKYNIDKSSF